MILFLLFHVSFFTWNNIVYSLDESCKSFAKSQKFSVAKYVLSKIVTFSCIVDIITLWLPELVLQYTFVVWSKPLSSNAYEKPLASRVGSQGGYSEIIVMARCTDLSWVYNFWSEDFLKGKKFCGVLFIYLFFYFFSGGGGWWWRCKILMRVNKQHNLFMQREKELFGGTFWAVWLFLGPVLA